MMTDYEVICSFLGREGATSARLQAEVRAGRETTDPRSDRVVTGVPTAILWCGEQPVAALVGTVVLVNRGARDAEHRRLVMEEAERRGRDVQVVREPDLWRLAA